VSRGATHPGLSASEEPATGWSRSGSTGVVLVQTSRQRDLSALALVLAVLLVLLVTSIALGSPVTR